MGRKCAVPHCYTGYRKCKEKASLYRVPDDDFFLGKWQEAIAREDRPITPKDYVCEKHFKDDDILRRRIIKDVVEEYQRPRLKPDAIPSIFPDLPEFILKMVKKRRKMPLEDSKVTEICDDTMKKSKTDETIEQDVNGSSVETEIKTEAMEPDESEDAANTMGDAILNNELDIKSESEENTENSAEKEGENELYILGPKMHQCDECDYHTKYPHNLRTHKTKHLTGDEAYIRCKYCPNFKTKWELTYRNHLKIKHGVGKQETFKCSLCSFETKVKLCLKRHFERHQRNFPTATLSCDFPGCDFKNENKGVLDVHKLSHVPQETLRKFKCSDCSYATNSKTHILKHMKDTHSAANGTTIPKKNLRTDDSKTDTPHYRCLKCSYRSKSQGNLLKHVFKHGSNGDTPKSKVWKCPSCPFASFFQHALQKHRETECGNFRCGECDFKTSYKPNFIRHSLTHRNVTVESVNQGRFVVENDDRATGKMKTVLEKESSDVTLKNVNGAGEVESTPVFVTIKSEVVVEDVE